MPHSNILKLMNFTWRIPSAHHYKNKSVVPGNGKCNGSVITTIRSYHYQRKIGQKRDPEIEKLERDAATLNLPVDCDQTQVREQYIKLAKKFHPDSGSPEADHAVFQKIDTAYKSFQKRFADQRHNRHKIEGEYGLYYNPTKSRKQTESKVEEESDEEGPDIKHTAPQHRQYLSFDGVGSGSPLHREKQYQKYRALKAADNLVEHRIKQVTKGTTTTTSEETALSKDRKAAKKIKTGIGMERLVEDLIQQSMARGDFDNLTGKGKPLKHDSSYNPYIDFTTHKLNQVLIDNGFTPEWILLEKEIRDEITNIRRKLTIERHSYSEIVTLEEEDEWGKFINDRRQECESLNKMILKYNLVVPSLHKQMISFQLEKEAKKAKDTFSEELRKLYEKEIRQKKLMKSIRISSQQEDSLLNSFFSIFKL